MKHLVERNEIPKTENTITETSFVDKFISHGQLKTLENKHTINKENLDNLLKTTPWYYATELNFKPETCKKLLPTGPIDYITLNNLFLNGTLNPKTLVWNAALKDWVEACSLDIFQFVSNATNTNDEYSSSPPSQE